MLLCELKRNPGMFLIVFSHAKNAFGKPTQGVYSLYALNFSKYTISE